MIYILNKKRYRQINIEVNGMDEDRTAIFLIPENSKFEYKIEELMCTYHFTENEVIEELPEVFYMCTLYDDRIERNI